MNIKRLALSAMIASACFAAPAMAQQTRVPVVRKTAYTAPETVQATESPSDFVAPASSECGCTSTPAPSCDNGCKSCDSNACDSMGGCGSGLLGGGLLGGGCCLDEPWKLFKGDNCYGITIAGWSQLAMHTSRNAGNGLFAGAGAASPANFNTYDKGIQLQQQWIYAERIADGSCGLDFGGRIDYLYGTDGPDTQAFGIANNHWDNGWDNGVGNVGYGHAMPQLYGEVAYGNTSVKMGHFFTIVGQEVVAATGNFFYSRQFTFYNAEPFTHTGLLATTKISDQTTSYGGYVTGWDSGFEDNGDSYISGFKHQLTDTTNVLYTNVLGRFNDDPASPNAGERGQIHSLIFTNALSDNLSHIFQIDHLDTHYANQNTSRQTTGLINYLIYKVNNCWSVGSRSEWFNYTSGNAGGLLVRNGDLYNQTFGVNYRPHANLLFRPEVRWTWDKERTYLVNENAKSSQATFGTDMIFTF